MTTKTTLATLVTILGWLAVLVGAPRTASAQSGQVEVFLQVKPQEAGTATANDAPMIEATVVGGANLPIDKFLLTEPTAKPPVIIKASSKRDFNSGGETIAVALVINGQEVWIGNDDIEPEDSPSRYLGILKNLKTALQEVPFATAGPAGSKGILISYADKPEVKVAMGPLGSLNAEALGSQKDYYKKIGTAMVEGISLALAELKNVSASRKALIVVCDGNDSNPDSAGAALANLKKEAQQQNIQTFAIIYKGQLSDPANLINKMITQTQTVTNAEGIAAAIKGILLRLADRYYLTFPGYDKKTKQGFKWDEKTHDLVLKIDKDETEAVSLQLSPKWSPPSKSSFPWWIVIVGVVGLLLLIVIIAAVSGKKEAPAPMPMPVMPAAPVVPGEPPKPMGPVKTVMFNANASEDGFPVVGWLVPLNGQDAFKTHKLRSSGTKIGTQPNSDIVINDGFMSTDHCKINCSPHGFVLEDNNSTNGCYVNDRKVTKHELVDNDVITLGKTNLKFKSIT
ncbi:MAG: FHA domain-containing protein [Kofleriaceae bacterium]